MFVIIEKMATDYNFYWELIKPWLIDEGVRILLIILGAAVLLKFSGLVIEKAIRRAIVIDKKTRDKAAERKREDTLIQVSTGSLRLLVWVAAGLMVLSEFGVEIGPVLAAAGIAGVAIGFGGQYLIRDIISGLFIIMENQYRVGDVVCLGETCGMVEAIDLRSTILRDLDGIVHHVPNGEIKVASNLSKDFSRINLNIGVGYNSNMEKVIKVVNKVGEELAKDREWKEHIIKAPAFERVNDFGDSAIEIKILGDVEPLQQWAVAGEMRKRLKIAFDKESIEIPFPQRVIHQAK